MSVATIAAAIQLRKEREIVSFLKDRSAVSAEAAIPLASGRMMDAGVLRALIGKGAVIDTGSGTYYLDNEAYEASRSKRRIPLALMLALALFAIVAIFVTNNQLI